MEMVGPSLPHYSGLGSKPVPTLQVGNRLLTLALVGSCWEGLCFRRHLGCFTVTPTMRLPLTPSSLQNQGQSPQPVIQGLPSDHWPQDLPKPNSTIIRSLLCTPFHPVSLLPPFL